MGITTFYLAIPYLEEGTDRTYLFEEMETAFTKEQALAIKNSLVNFTVYDGIIIKRIDLKQ
ncbi:MAG: hypothetical protein ACO4CS_16830 [bacterium]